AHRAKLNHSRTTNSKPQVAYRQRVAPTTSALNRFNAPEVWYEPTGRAAPKFIVQPAGPDYVHPVTVAEVPAPLALLPPHLVKNVEVVQFSRMTRKRRAFPCYGMQWGHTVYLYPIEASLVEAYVCPPKPAQQIEARMFGGKWSRDGKLWTLTWTP